MLATIESQQQDSESLLIRHEQEIVSKLKEDEIRLESISRLEAENGNLRSKHEEDANLIKNLESKVQELIGSELIAHYWQAKKTEADLKSEDKETQTDAWTDEQIEAQKAEMAGMVSEYIAERASMLATIEAQQHQAVELAARHEQALKEAHDSHHEEKERLEEVVSQI